jgi:hypothetical protein
VLLMQNLTHKIFKSIDFFIILKALQSTEQDNIIN